MGRYDFRPLRVYQTASQLFASERIRNVPSWHEVVGTVPPAQTLVRTQPLQHQQRPRRNNVRKPSKIYQPQRVVYEEDSLRKEFFGDHPWELARPRVVLENDGRDAEKKDWSLVSQPDRPIDGERSVLPVATDHDITDSHKCHPTPDVPAPWQPGEGSKTGSEDDTCQSL